MNSNGIKPIHIHFWVLLPFFLVGAIWAITSIVDPNSSIEEINRGIISKATMDGVDIGNRKAFFTHSFLILLVWIFGLFANLYIFKEWIQTNFDNIWPVSLGALGILFTFISPIFNLDLSLLRTLIASSSFVYIIGLLLNLSRTETAYSIIGGLALFVSINLFTSPINIGLGIIGISTLLLFVQRFVPMNNPVYTKIYGVPLMALSIVLFSYTFKYDVGVLGALIGLSIGLLFSWRYNKNIDFLLLITLILLVSVGYWGTDLSYHYDLFESGNPGNSIQRVLYDGELPFIHYLSSHLLSEQFVPLIHDLLVSASEKLDWMSWLFMLKVLNAVIIFYVLKAIFKSAIFPFIIIAFFPLTQWLFPKEYVVALLPLIMILRIGKEGNTKEFVWLFAMLFLGLFWKIDSGIGAYAASLFLIGILVFDKKIEGKKVIKGLAWVLGVLIILFGVIQLCHHSLIDNLINTLEYFTGDQAHGRSVLVNGQKDLIFHFHHYILPVLVLIILAFVLKSRRTGNPALTNILIFLSVFYFMNFQRGLVRHSFTSGTDIYLSSFGYLILTLSAIYLIDLVGIKRSEVKKFMLFCAIGSLTLSVLSFGNRLKKQDVVSRVLKKIDANHDAILLHQQWTNGRNKMLSKESASFKSYLDRVLKDNETFFDFSNRPLLYYLTNRSLPNYFNQVMQNTVTAHQQELAINRLQNNAVPIVLYSYIPRAWLDATDDVPNGLRYHVVHDYIKENYRPLGSLENKWLWLRKDLDANSYIKGLKEHNEEQWNVDLGKLPGYFQPEISNSQRSIDFYKVRLNTKNGTVKARLYNINGEHKITFRSNPDMDDYYIPIDWLAAPIDSIRIENNVTFSHQKVSGKY